MPVIYQTIDGELAKPDNDKDQLHEYHNDINELVDCEVIGLTGAGSKIRTISLSEKCNVSNLEDWLNSDLKIKLNNSNPL